jgi:predicted SnoaL-like aldol condensation-catalyzing enzyme
MTNREIMDVFADLLYRQKKVAEAFNTCVAKDYIQHGPMLGDGPDEAITALTPKFANPEARFTVLRILVDRDYAVIIAHADTAGQQGAVVDIYRLDGGKIVEHWDIGTKITDHPKSARPHF